MVCSDTVNLTKQLITKKSITPFDNGCQEIIAARLKRLGFRIKCLSSGDVTNLFAIRGTGKSIFAFAGHTDVVPAGDISSWNSHPFVPFVRGNKIFGRGVSDMKAALAVMVTSVENFIRKTPQHPGSIAFLITSDEEGEAQHGTKKIVDYLKKNNIYIDACIVGEPTSAEIAGDTIKIGRRGALTGHLTIEGIQGHVAYPHNADNPIHKLTSVMKCLQDEKWDNGNEYFPKTSFQVTDLDAGNGVDNIIPQNASMLFNLRYSSEHTNNSLKDRIHEVLEQHEMDFKISWKNECQPYITKSENFVDIVKQTVAESIGVNPKLSTGGGTSDGRFISDVCDNVIELGVCNKTMHSVNECVVFDDIVNLQEIYSKLLMEFSSNLVINNSSKIRVKTA